MHRESCCNCSKRKIEQTYSRRREGNLWRSLIVMSPLLPYHVSAEKYNGRVKDWDLSFWKQNKREPQNEGVWHTLDPKTLNTLIMIVVKNWKNRKGRKRNWFLFISLSLFPFWTQIKTKIFRHDCEMWRTKMTKLL